MDKFLRPERLDVSPSSPTAAREWKHWKRTFTAFLRSIEAHNPDKLDTLINFVSPTIYEYIAECVTYDSAINLLQELYIKPKNEVFARHSLATRRQQEGETIDEYLQELQLLSKDCNFKAVTASQNRDDYVRDSFINGLLSHTIRQRLLENKTLDLSAAVDQARALDTAQKNSEFYSRSAVQAVGAAATSELASADDGTCAAVTRSKCYFCGGSRHNRTQCPARNVTCHKCNKQGHFAKVCRSAQSSTSASTQSPTLATISASSPGLLTKATVYVLVGSNEATALIDTGSSESFISYEYARKNKVKIIPATGSVSMASSSLTSPVKGRCTVDINLQGEWYSETCLSVLPDLCCDVILGQDFMSQHSSITVAFGGPKKNLTISNAVTCSVPSASVDTPHLFSNLAPHCKPIAIKSRRFGDDDKKFIKSEVDKMLQEGVIEESTSPWRAQVLIVANERQRKRLVIDYSRTINRFTRLDAYPLPRMDDLATEISRYKYYSSLDLKSAYHQIPIRKEDRPYTAFEANGKLYQFCRIPFGVTNGVACFQRTIDNIIKRNDLQGIYAYVDNIVVTGKTQLEHDKNLAKFLEVAQCHNLVFNKDKSVLNTTSIDFLGYTITYGSLKPDADRLRPLKELPTPVDRISLRRVIGMFSYYSQWVSKFSDKIRPLVVTDTFPLSPEALKAFSDLKEEIGKAVVHSIDETIPLVVETDASDTAIAATLNQAGRPVAFFSRTLTPTECKHSSVEKEAYAIVESVKKWSHYLAGRRFTLVTDQQAVSFMFHTEKLGKIKNDKIQRWRIELGCYNYDIVYRPGRNNIPADTLSRAYCGAAVNYEKLFDLHTQLCHPGVTRLAHFVRARNLPYSMEDVRRVCSGCPLCARLKPRFYKPDPTSLIKATQPFERLCLDFKGPLPSNSRHRYMLTVVDEYSRFPFAFACQDMTVKTIIQCLNQIFAIFGMPSYLHSDRGPSFMAKELRDYLTNLGIACSRTTPYNPQGNGQCERYNGIIWKHVALALASKNLQENQWETVLPDALHSVRSLLCTATNATPHERLFSFHRRSPSGHSLPTWLSVPGPVLLRRHVRVSKYDPLVDEVQLLEANPQYAHIRFADGRESTVSVHDLAPAGNRTQTEMQKDIHVDPCTESDSVETHHMPSVGSPALEPSDVVGNQNITVQEGTTEVDSQPIATQEPTTEPVSSAPTGLEPVRRSVRERRRPLRYRDQ